jgi:hypothetical protein
MAEVYQGRVEEETWQETNQWLIENIGYDYAGFASLGVQLVISADPNAKYEAVRKLAELDGRKLEIIKHRLLSDYALEDDPDLDFFAPEIPVHRRLEAMHALTYAAHELELEFIGGNKDPKAIEPYLKDIADSAAEAAKAKIALGPLLEQIAELEEENNKSKKLTIASKLGVLLTDFKIQNPGWESFHHLRFDVEDIETYTKQEQANFEFHAKLETIPPIDQQEFDKLRLTYGAKAANLMLLSDRLEAINVLWADSEMPVEIPPFFAIPAESYDVWVNGQEDDSLLMRYFEQLQALLATNRGIYSCVVRSSAVHSEDGELTGAGIYKSVRVNGYDPTFEDFKEAIHDVYKSVSSRKAQEYRRSYGVENESMGIVVQLYANGEGCETVEVMQGLGLANFFSYTGTIDTLVPGLPYMRNDAEGAHSIVARNAVSAQLGELYPHPKNGFIPRDNINLGIFKIKPDLIRVHPAYVQAMSVFGMVAEKLWGGPVQIEYSTTTEGSPAILQVRKLPKNIVEHDAPKIEFPDEQPVYSAPAVGFIDEILDVLPCLGNNYDKKGLVIIPQEKMATINNYGLPKEGAVIVLQGGEHGSHMSTLALEQGLPVMLPDYYVPIIDELIHQALRPQEGEKYRVVMNGTEGRIYRV